MAWVAADRAVKAVEQAAMEGPLDRWRAVRDEIRRDIMTKGFDEQRNTFTQYDGVSGVGCCPVDDPPSGVPSWD